LMTLGAEFDVQHLTLTDSLGGFKRAFGVRITRRKNQSNQHHAYNK